MVTVMSGRQRKVFDRLSIKIGAVAVTGIAAVAAFAQAPAAPAYKPGEGDLVQAIQKETDPNKKVQELKDWAQKFPDSINKPEWKDKSNVILKPGETYKQTTIYHFKW